jgi:hypothetical protein
MICNYINNIVSDILETYMIRDNYINHVPFSQPLYIFVYVWECFFLTIFLLDALIGAVAYHSLVCT